ncbi:MAG: hypothetical protein HY000_26955 [Planctomycetes bacterium]|nr:hypothetical protein [Planctomycetota bacterium]
MQVIAEIGTRGPGVCFWCRVEKPDMVEVRFKDGSLHGKLCTRHFWHALSVRSNGVEEPKTAGLKQ